MSTATPAVFAHTMSAAPARMDQLPQDVVSFVAANLRSLDELQVLMQCIDGPGRWWDASTMARETGLGEAAAQRALDHLARRNLLDIRVTAELRYTFSPGTEALRDDALACGAAYRSRPVAVVKLVTGDHGRHIRDFADAFRIRRHDDS